MQREMAGDNVLAELIAEMVTARSKGRDSQVAAINRAFKRALESVSSLDEDRIMFAFSQVIKATLRTNYYQLDAQGLTKECISFKIDCRALAGPAAATAISRDLGIFTPV